MTLVPMQCGAAQWPQYKYPQTDGQRNAETFSSDYNNREKNSQPWIQATQIDFDRRIVTGHLAVDAGHHLC